MNYQDQEDRRMLNQYSKTEDQLWIARLFRKYEHLIYGICLKYTNDPDWSKDLKGQIYEKLVLKAKNLEVGDFKNWLYSFSKNLCHDELRKKKRKASALDKFRKFQINSIQDVDSGIEERLIIKHDEEQLSILMEDAEKLLTEKQRICLNLFYFNRFSYLKIGAETGMEITQIKSHLQNGKRKMKNYIFQQLKNHA